MNPRLTVAGILVLLTIAVLVVVIRQGGAPPATSQRTLRPHPAKSAEIRAVNLRLLEVLRNPADGSVRDPFAFAHRPRVVRTALTRSITITNESVESSALPAQVAVPTAALLPVRFVGTLETRQRTWAVFSDCGGYIRASAEGDRVLGQWRLVAIGIESVSLESLDGRQITARMTGCRPR
jgi:hypothetical protein